MWQTKGKTSLDHEFSLINETLQSHIVLLCGLHDRDQRRSGDGVKPSAIKVALSPLCNADCVAQTLKITQQHTHQCW